MRGGAESTTGRANSWSLGDNIRCIGRRPASLDVVLVAPRADGDPPVELVEVAPPDHPRVERARRYGHELRVWQTADGAGLVTVGRGLGGRWEAAFEVEPDARGR